MATSRTVIERIANVSGFSPSTLDGMLRSLRSAGLVPMGEKGRGRLRGHYDTSDLANVIASFGSFQPIDAAEMALLFRNLPYKHTWQPAVDQPPWPPSDSNAPHIQGATFGEALEHMIEGRARVQAQRGVEGISREEATANVTSRASDPSVMRRMLPHFIQLRHGPVRAELHWLMPANGRTGRIDFYYSQEPSRSYAVTRMMHIDTSSVVDAAAELLSSNPLRQTTLLPSSPAPAGTSEGQKRRKRRPARGGV